MPSFIVSYVLVLAWLLLLLTYNTRKQPVRNMWVYGYACFAVGLNIFLYQWVGVISVVLSVLIAFLFALTGAVKRNTTLVLAGTFLGLPLWGWWVAVPGILFGAFISFWKIRKVAGKGYTALLTAETLAGFGLMPENTGAISKPDPSRFPFTPPEQKNKSGVFHKVSLISIPFTVYILVSVFVCGGLFFLIRYL